MANVGALPSSAPPRSAGTDGSVVKSAGRALQILEYFDSVQREACVSEISRALQCPQSSTSVLLRSLVHLGYLQNDRYRRTYYPTRRVSLLGNWVDPAIVRQGELLMHADELAAQTGQTVVIATVNSLQTQYIYVSRPQAEQADFDALHVGMHCPLARTALGKALLAGHSDKHVSQLTWRINGERSEYEPLIHASELLAELERGRERGWFAGEGADSSHSGVAVMLDCKQQLLSIGIEQRGPIPEAQALSYAELLKTLAAEPQA
jgi:DNA-binding IclR family transcriptional regulator